MYILQQKEARRTWVYDLVHRNPRLVGHESNDGEHSKSCVQAREEADDVDHDGVPENHSAHITSQGRLGNLGSAWETLK